MSTAQAQGLPRHKRGVAPLQALTLSLATARLTQLVVEDEITRPVRIAVENLAEGAPEFSWRERLDTVVNCGACSSVWAGAAVLIAEQTGVGRFLVRVLALSQAALGARALIDKLEESE